MVNVVNRHTHLHTHVHTHTHTQERTDAFGRDGSVYALTGARMCPKSSNRAHYIRVVSHVSVIPQRPWTREGLARENRTSIVRIKTIGEDTSREKRGKAVCPSVPVGLPGPPHARLGDQSPWLGHIPPLRWPTANLPSPARGWV